MTTSDAIAALQDAIRAEVTAELVRKLEELAQQATATDCGEDYLDGVRDALTTISR